MIDVTARRRAEAARERLQQATEALAGAVTVADVAAVAIEQAGQALDADAAVLLLLDAERGVLQIAADHNLGGTARGRWRTLSWPSRCRPPRPRASGRRLRRPTRRRCSSASRTSRARRTRARAPYAALPLVAYGRTLGVLSLGFARPVAFDDDERGLLTALAAQAAIAIARAQLYEREHAVSQTLQASLLPRALPEVPGLDLAGRLEAGAKGVEVGGDFYDAFAISDGAWGVAIGDVCGKGVDAAALTALARHTVRAAAHAHDSPAAVLRRAQPRGARREPPGAVPDRDLRPPDAAAAAAASASRRPAAGTRRRSSSTRAGAPRELDVRRARCSASSKIRRSRTRRSTCSPATRCCSTPTGSPRRTRPRTR